MEYYSDESESDEGYYGGQLDWVSDRIQNYTMGGKKWQDAVKKGIKDGEVVYRGCKYKKVPNKNVVKKVNKDCKLKRKKRKTDDKNYMSLWDKFKNEMKEKSKTKAIYGFYKGCLYLKRPNEKMKKMNKSCKLLPNSTLRLYSPNEKVLMKAIDKNLKEYLEKVEDDLLDKGIDAGLDLNVFSEDDKDPYMLGMLQDNDLEGGVRVGGVTVGGKKKRNRKPSKWNDFVRNLREEEVGEYMDKRGNIKTYTRVNGKIVRL